jgi:acyl-CoA synthetase (AMP-forming)/AMP-acid ligase II
VADSGVPPATTPALVDWAADRYGAAEALVDGERRWSFRELAAEVHGASRAFVATGVGRGDRVAIWAPNVAEWVIGALGAQMAGAAIVPLNTRFKGHEAADLMMRSRASVLLTVNGFLGTDYVGMLRSTGIDLPELTDVVVLRGEAPDDTVSWADFVARSECVDPAAAGEIGGAVQPGDLSDIIFTSGTTGRPKGVMCTHEQTIRVFEDWSGIVGLAAGDRYLIVNPFFHTFGYKAGFLSCLIRGATIVPEPVFDVDAVLARVAQERISVLPGPPTLLLSILNHRRRDEYDLSSLRLTVTGAAPVPVEMIRRMREELTFRTIITGYGLTESTGTIAMCRADDDPETVSATSGRAIHDVEVRVVDDDGVEVPRGTPGEIVCRGYNVMQGYLDDPEATAETIDAEGWLHTGDIGVMDERGYLRITDRKKDMFIVGGFNAYPAEIENMILAHPAIAQVAVVGVPDDRMGEVGHAFVVARAGVTVDGDELIAWCRERMANYKVPRAVHVVDALPLNASGKVLKFELRSRISQETTRPTPGAPSASTCSS